MAQHVAILLPRYIRLILEGRKTVESRLTRHPIVPYRRVRPGDRIHFKASSGPYLATALAESVEFFDDLTPARVAELRRRFNDAVCGDADYWRWKRHSRYATFIALRDVKPVNHGPAIAPSRGIAWFVLPDGAAPEQAHRDRPSSAKAPSIDTALTAGALRNRYLRLAGPAPGLITLILPDGRTVRTELTPRRLVRWRGWGAYYSALALRAGDRVRLLAAGPRRYHVAFLRHEAE